jgi:hypothetical protein
MNPLIIFSTSRMPNNTKINKNALFKAVRNTLSKKPERLGSLSIPAIKPLNVLGGKRKTHRKIKRSRKVKK